MIKVKAAARIVVAAGAFVAGLGLQAASAQNFFQMLFGGGPQPREGRSSYAPDSGNLFGSSRPSSYDRGVLDPNDPRLHREIIRRRAAKAQTRGTGGTGGSIGRQTAVLATADAPRGSIAYFAKDKTLRSGDVVVTEKGFLIFQGGANHDAKSFVAIDQSAGSKTDRKNLLALEEVSRMRTPNLTFETTAVVRDFIGPRLPEQMDALFMAQSIRTASR